MRSRLLFLVLAFAAALAAGPGAARADETPYAQFTAGAQAQRGLFTVLKKGGKVYLELSPDQMDRDYIETVVPGTGLGGNFVVWGNTDHLPAMLVRFVRAGDKVAIVWPNTSFVAKSADARRAIERNFPQSVVGLGDIATTDPKSGSIVFDVSSLLGDVLDLNTILAGSLRTNPGSSYHLDPSRSYFGATKAFPENILIEADQTWSTQAPHIADVAPDARNVQMRVEYNFALPPHDGDYIPRYADDRIGLYDDVYLQFDNDRQRERQLRYLIRWNIRPSDPSKALSPATHPMVLYLSNTIPPRYRPVIRDAMLAWNAAFERIGISHAIEVRDQPDDPSWDADDIRYSVIRWTTEAQPSFGADSQTLYDPRTGQEFRTGILVSANSATSAANDWKLYVDPVRFGRAGDRVPEWFIDQSIRSEILHETGHNLGMQHNFIGSEAYTARELQDKSFTSTHGITSTVMEYAPMNLWPKPYGQGDYFQTVLGPYDYFTIKWGYAPIRGATTPEAELPTLQRWAQAWSDPRYRYASDEDVAWRNGHAADPRVNTGDLTNDPLGWCKIQMQMNRALLHSIDRRLPAHGEAYEAETQAFRATLGRYLGCATLPAHFIGGQFISRAHRGDPMAQAPIVPVSRAEQKRAFDLLDRMLFADSAWRFDPRTLSHLGYSEWAGYGYVGWTGYGNLPVWAYAPPDRHDFPIVEQIGRSQMSVIDEMFEPLVLQRIVDNQLETTTPTMSLHDLFAWLQSGIFADLGTASSTIRRNLQTHYAQRLIALANAPAAAAPPAAQELARLELRDLAERAHRALSTRGVTIDGRAHIESLAHLVAGALK
ncbi:MAG: zinc-dependent metalloprotease [Candidatus Eremiobacteraeota bacterium]|nr:zinc-dependent metalloprotease [Candidatus Eremiobacteraeota bacterium]